MARAPARAAGTVHVPADQLPAALLLAPADWAAAHRCPKPDKATWLVLQSRTSQRAAWAAQVPAPRAAPQRPSRTLHVDGLGCPDEDLRALEVLPRSELAVGG